ncbi:MAG: transglycosylase domain-containing protein [Candidatus Andersenbacteria bacterium]
MATRRYKRQSSWLHQLRSTTLNRRIIPRLLAVAGAGFLVMAGTVLWWSRDLPDPQQIQETGIGESTKIYDSTGTHLLYEIGEARRTYTSIGEISPLITQATLAAEDDQFYAHHGLDFGGILRGVILKPLSGRRVQGGSTITQQLIKNSILTPERTIRRKAKEAVLALELEQRFGKDEILEMYLNAIPYGSRAYGVEAAAQIFFGTSAKNVSLAQATILAALPQAPSYYSPYGSHFEDLKFRQEHILNRMADLNMVSKEEAEAAKSETLTFSPPHENIEAPHFVFYVKELLEEEYGERVVEQGGLRVITTLDARLQSVAEDTLKNAQERLVSQGASNSSLVAIHPVTGNILAMVGSIDYFNEDIDGNVNVSIRHRSPGSSIKPFIYAAAFEKGFAPETILVDAETDFGQGYIPKNYDLAEHGPVTMRSALANSYNIPAVKALYLVGVRTATDLAQRMGMTSLSDPDRYGLSLVLGGGEVRLVDITSAYGVFAAEGTRYPARAVLKVEDAKEVLFDATAEQPQGTQVLDPQVARLTTDVLSDNNARAAVFGTRSFLQLGSRPVGAKTGTTQDSRDGWTIGFTPSLAAGVWVGNNDNSPMGKGAAGSNTAAFLWNTFMKGALDGTPIEQFTKPAPLPDTAHGILRGQIREVKGKWVSETNTLYTNECPVAQGQPRTLKELHSILFYVRRTNPLGDPPARAEADPQFNNWEAGIAQWRDKHNEKNKDVAEEPLYFGSLPEPSCNVGSEEELPKVKIIEPNTTVLRDSPTQVTVEIDSPHRLREVRFVLDGQEIARKGPDGTHSATITFDKNFSGRKTLIVMAITENNFIGQAHRTFIINPDDSSPTITIHTPQNNLTLAETNFPYTVKVTAKDSSGVDFVDMLYIKEGQPGTKRIARTNTQAPTAPDRYEAVWQDSPGLGTYTVYAVAYDKTGNFTESERHTVTIK